jgi:hypothetical protein
MAGFDTLRNATITGRFSLQVQAEQANQDALSTETMQTVFARIPLWQQAIRYGNGSASRHSLLPLRDAVMAATAEGSDPAPTAFSPTNRDLATARNAILFSLGDDEVNRIPVGMESIIPALSMDLSQQPNQAEMEALMALGVLGYFAFVNRVMVLVKALANSWGTLSFGGSGSDPTYAVIQGLTGTMADAGNRGRGLWMTTRPHFNHFRDNVLGLSGAVQFSALAQRITEIGLQTVIKDVVPGLDCAIVTGLPVVVGDTIDQAFTPTGIDVKVETPPLQSGSELIGSIGSAEAPLVTFERRRTAGSTSVISVVSWIGVGIADDSAGAKGTFAT